MLPLEFTGEISEIFAGAPLLPSARLCALTRSPAPSLPVHKHLGETRRHNDIINYSSRKAEVCYRLLILWRWVYDYCQNYRVDRKFTK